MAKASDNEFPSVLFAEQGSDPATPGTGLWRAFFKSGGMYVIDDAGTVTGPFTASTAGGSIPHKLTIPTSGATSINTAGSWANLSAHVATYTDITLDDVAAGDVIVARLAGMWANQSAWGYLDFASIVSAAIVNTFSGGASDGIRGLLGVNAAWTPFDGAAHYTVQAGDISAGSITVRARVKTSGAKTLNHDPGQFSLLNLGPVQA